MGAVGSLALLAEELLEGLLPAQCVCCGKVGTWVCLSCVPEKWQLRCERIQIDSIVTIPLLSGIQYTSDSWIGQAITAGKERGWHRIWPWMGSDMRHWLTEQWGEVGVVAVPSTKKRLRERGFAHMSQVAHVLGVPVGGVRREDKGVRQRGGTRQERLENEIQVTVQSLPSLPLVIIDDVYTTGASVRATARAVQDAGGRVIGVCTFARTY